jgi:hypothetical protein
VDWVFRCNLGIRDLIEIEIDLLSDVPVRAICIEDSGSVAARIFLFLLEVYACP